MYQGVTSLWMVVMFSLATVCAAEEGLILCPQPKEMRFLAQEEALNLARGAAIKSASGFRKPVGLAVERLKEEILARADRQHEAAAPATVIVGCLEDIRNGEFNNAVPKDLMEQAAKLPAEGYVLRASDLKAIIVGKDVNGTVYGIETLIQLTRRGPRVPAVEILDYPGMAMRPTYCAGGGRLDARLRRIVRLCVHYKLNMIVFENDEFYHLDDPQVRKGVQEVFDFCKDMGIEPIPELQSFGWSQCILPIDPICVEALPARNRRFKFKMNDVAEPFYRPILDLAVVNAGLDEAEGNKIIGWQQDDVGRSIFSEVSPKGGRCVMIKREMPGTSRVFQRIRCEPDTCYEFQTDMKTEAGKDFAAYFEVYGYPSLEHNREFIAYPAVNTTSEWQRRSLRFKTGPARELVIYLRIQQGIGTAWFDNVTIRSAQELPMVNVVETPEQPIIVTSIDGHVTYKRGEDYDVEPGELRFPFPDNLKPWIIRRKKGGAIQAGQEVLVSYEWAEPGDITYCPSEPRTHEIMKKAIEDTIRIFRPRFLHIGHDEPRVMNRDTRCRKRGMQAHELYVEDICRMYQFVKQADPQCRVMMWSDAFRVNDEGQVKVAWFSEEKCLLSDAVKALPRDIIMCAWRYTETDEEFLMRDLTTLAGEGFAVTCSPWYDYKNAAAWARVIERFRRESDKCIAFFLTTWDDRWDALPLCADIMWAPGGVQFKEAGAGLEAKLKSRYGGFETYSK